MLEAFFVSLSVVALAEIGDKTMLLAIVLAAKLRAPVQIVLGILAATIANHALAAFVGVEVAGVLEARWFRIAVALGFLAMAAWTLVPDTLDDDEDAAVKRRGGAFLTTLISFFIVEMGDKTQVATIALGAHYQNVAIVAAGTTVGMLLVNGPSVFLGDKLTRVIPLKLTRMLAAALFAILGVWQLLSLPA